MDEVITARLLRLATIRNFYKANELTQSEAEELLRGPLSPDDKSTTVDDSHLLNDDKALEKLVAVSGYEKA